MFFLVPVVSLGGLYDHFLVECCQCAVWVPCIQRFQTKSWKPTARDFIAAELQLETCHQWNFQGPPIMGPLSYKLPIPFLYFNGFLWEWYGSTMGMGVPLFGVPGISLDVKICLKSSIRKLLEAKKMCWDMADTLWIQWVSRNSKLQYRGNEWKRPVFGHGFVGQNEPLASTPWKINMEPKNHQIEKANYLPNLLYGGSMLMFQGGVDMTYPSLMYSKERRCETWCEQLSTWPT